ncbi:MAG: hypothetical protein ACRC46_10695 [Thermoguttaceae bacterium]
MTRPILPPPPRPRRLTSPFALETLRGVPMPTFAAIFAVVLLAGMSWWWCGGFTKDAAANASKSDGALMSFLDRERQRGVRPSIIIAGSSVNGMSIYRDLLEARLDESVGKTTIVGGGVWECERILKKYQHDTQNVKIVYLDLRMICQGTAVGCINGDVFRSLYDFSDIRDLRLYESLHKKGVVPESRLELFINEAFPYRVSFRSLKKSQKLRHEYVDYLEHFWTDTEYVESYKTIQNDLTCYTADVMWETKDVRTQSHIKQHLSSCSQYSIEMESWTWDFVQYCEGRGIFVVFNVPPCWRTLSQLPDPNDPNLTIDQKKYLALFDKLDAHTNCRVIVLKDFQSIIPDAVDAEYLFDTHHMTKNGATVYTHWLADQTLRDEKICAHLGIPCQTDAQTDFIKLIAELGMTVPQSETQSSETRVAETGATVK